MKRTIVILISVISLLSFSHEARCQSIENADWWLPRKEIGMRHGFGSVGYSREFTLGYRLNDWWTAGLSCSMEKTVGVYARRYFYLSEGFRFAAYVDGMIGASFTDNTELAAKVEPGVMFRFFNNHQIYLGPSLDTHGFGFHIGFAI